MYRWASSLRRNVWRSVRNVAPELGTVLSVCVTAHATTVASATPIPAPMTTCASRLAQLNVKNPRGERRHDQAVPIVLDQVRLDVVRAGRYGTPDDAAVLVMDDGCMSRRRRPDPADALDGELYRHQDRPRCDIHQPRIFRQVVRNCYNLAAACFMAAIDSLIRVSMACR